MCSRQVIDENGVFCPRCVQAAVNQTHTMVQELKARGSYRVFARQEGDAIVVTVEGQVNGRMLHTACKGSCGGFHAVGAIQTAMAIEDVPDHEDAYQKFRAALDQVKGGIN